MRFHRPPVATSEPAMDVHQLILSIRKRTCLWDHADKNHFNRDLAQRHWMEVAQEMGSTYEIVKKKWKGLKDVFRKELKKIASSQTGVISTWTHFHDMMFLRDQMSPKELVAPLESLVKAEMIVDDYSPSEGDIAHYQSAIQAGQFSRLNNGDESSASSQESASQIAPALPVSNKKRKLDTTDADCYSDVFPSTGNLNKDPDYNFLISFLPYLKSLSPKKKLLYRMKLCQLIYETAYSDE